MPIFETHAHLDFPEFNEDRDRVIQTAFDKGVRAIVNIGIDEETTRASVDLAGKWPHIKASAGFHPHEAAKFDPVLLRELATMPEVVAIGEIGLDYYRDRSPRDLQRNIFAKQTCIAIDLNLPVVVHDRDAHEDTLAILRDHRPQRVVFHCFSGDAAFAEKVLAEGWMISFTGPVTFKNYKGGDVVRLVPDDRLMIETDCPFLTPHPYRGKRNSPAYLPYIIEAIAHFRDDTVENITTVTWDNACRFFGVSP